MTASTGSREVKRDEHRETGEPIDIEQPPPRWLRTLLLALAVLFFLFIIGVMIWGILDDLLSGGSP